MNIRDLSSQFSVYVFSRDVDRGAGMKVALAGAGYDCFFFEDQSQLVDRIQQHRPHVVIVTTMSVRESLSSLVEAILKQAPETRFIFLARKDQFATLAKYGSYGLDDILLDDAGALDARIVFSVDRACERLYLAFQNESLLEQAEQKTSPVIQQIPATALLEAKVQDYLSAASVDEFILKFFTNFKDQNLVYFKFLGSLKSLVVTHVQGRSIEGLSGLACQLSDEEGKNLSGDISMGIVPPAVVTFLKNGFTSANLRLWPIFCRQQLEGIIAVSADSELTLRDEFSLMSALLVRFLVEKRLDHLEVNDPITEVYNRLFYVKRLKEEWIRAQRHKAPLSLIKLALDDFHELDIALGETSRDHLLKKMAQILLKSSRANDLVCRININEFAMILPHCDRQGAMVRGERLRRYIESSQLVESGLKISISLGMSEYPTFCSTDEEIDDQASKALKHMMDHGGNRVCLAKAPPNHQPQFEVVVGEKNS